MPFVVNIFCGEADSRFLEEESRKAAEGALSLSPQMTEQRKNKQRLGFLGSNTPHANHHMPAH